MSGVEQRSEGTRLRRLLARALVFAGTAAAGTSAVWLLGSGLATAETGILDGVESSVGASEASAREPGRLLGEVRDRAAEFDLHELDASELVADAEAMTRAVVTVPGLGGTETDDPEAESSPVVDSVRGIVHEAEPVLEPVRKVTDEVVALDRHTLPETVETGVDSVEQLVSGTSEALPIASSPQDAPEPAPERETPEAADSGPRGAPPVPQANTAPTEPLPAPTPTVETRTTSSTDSRVVESDRDVADVTAVPSVPQPLPQPLPLPWHPLLPVAPSAPSCGCTGDGHGSNGGVGLGWLFGAALLSEPRTGITARRSAPVPTGGPKPQPGTTPD